MTREELIKNWDSIVAHKNGAVIQFRTIDDWVDVEDPLWSSGCEYRVKPQPQLVPFDYSDADKLIGKLLKSREYNNYYVITGVRHESAFIDNRWIDFKYLRDMFTFLDGTPCGKTIEQQ